MRDGRAIEGHRHARWRGRSRDCGDEVENGVSNVDIGGLFDDKAGQRRVAFVVEVTISDTPEKRI